jgi:hypothetical protein
MHRKKAWPLVAAVAVAVVASSSSACGRAPRGALEIGDDASVGADDDASPGFGSSGSGSGAGTSSGFTGSSGGGSVCTTGLCTQVVAGCSTTLSGVVYDPAGNNPLYNAVVFVPNDPKGALPKIDPGTKTCSTCDVAIGDFVSATLTDASGHFTLSAVPAGTNIPIVVQIGKWRREQFLPTVSACKDNQVPAAMTRLPRKQSEGDMPQMALVTGGCDNLGCFLSQVGIDNSEFGPPQSGGRLDVYKGGDLSSQGGPQAPGLSGGRSGAATDCSGSNCPLWSSKANLERYDLVVLACECSENDGNKPDKTPLHDWLAEGGKAFATHYQYTWFKNGPPDFQALAKWTATSSEDPVNGPFKADTSFPKGVALYDWLAKLGQLNANGTIPLAPSDVKTSVTTVNPPTLRWIYDSSTSPQDVKYMSMLTPIGGVPGTQSNAGGPGYCGKAVFTDIHTSGQPSGDIPGGCAPGTMSPQEMALEFLFFDLSSCVGAADTAPPTLPPK